MPRRVLNAVAAVAAALSLAGCAVLTSGDAAEAERVLEQATAAQEELESVTFGVRVQLALDGQTFNVRLDGGGYLKGEQAGDFVMQASADIPGAPMSEFGIVSRRSRLFVALNGVWEELPLPADAAAQDAALQAQLAGFDFSRYVKDVRVERATTFLGEPVTKIVGVIDTAGLVEGLFSQLGDLTFLGASPVPTGDLAEGLGDTRAVLYVSDATHLVRAALITMELEAEGETVEMRVDYALKSVDEPVEIPTPPIAA